MKNHIKISFIWAIVKDDGTKNLDSVFFNKTKKANGDFSKRVFINSQTIIKFMCVTLIFYSLLNPIVDCYFSSIFIVIILRILIY